MRVEDPAKCQIFLADAANRGGDELLRFDPIGNPRHRWLLLAVAIVGVVVAIRSGVGLRERVSLRGTPLLVELHELLLEPLVELRIAPMWTGKGAFEAHIVSDGAMLAHFRERALAADTRRVSGHSGAIFESKIVLRTDSKTMSLLASVHELEPEDLFLSRDDRTFHADGHVSSGRPVRIRIPKLGAWVMAIAPEARKF